MDASASWQQGGPGPIGDRLGRAADDGLWLWAVIGSLLLHLALAVALALRPMPPAPPPLEESIPVRIVSPGELEAALPRPAAPPAAPAPTPQEPQAAPDGLIRPSRIFGASAFADPRSRKALEALPTFAPDERVVQLCDVEALEQIHAWDTAFEPDLVIPYALDELELSGRSLVADGAAFHSGRHWYGVRFRCEVTADLTEVASFAFRVGAEIPESEWEAHGLPSEAEPAD